MAKEKTAPQVYTGVPTGGELPKSTSNYKTYRQMRKDPTISMARALSIAPILVTMWSVETTEGAPDDAATFIDKQMQPLRLHILKHCVAGNIDFGWQPFEKVFELNEQGMVVIKKVKQLLQDLTGILVDEATGDFVGLRQYDAMGNEINLNADECFVVSIDVEGTDWYGQPVMENIRPVYNKWNQVEEAADRYDRKVTGTHWVVYYPLGKSMYKSVETDNFDIAKDILKSLEASGMIAIPSTISQYVEGLNDNNQPAWKIELLTSSGGVTQFVERQNYLDKLKVRGLHLPERAVLEGQFGTKAEAEAHADFAITNMELRHALIVEEINKSLVQQLMRLNYGRAVEGTVYISPAPLNDQKRAYLRSLYSSILTNQEGFAQEMDRIDIDAMRDELDIPYKPVDVSVLPELRPIV